MNMQFTTSSYFLADIPVAILDKKEVIKHKMQQYKDVKVYLYSFVLPEYMSDEIVDSLQYAYSVDFKRDKVSLSSYIDYLDEVSRAMKY